MAIIDLGRVVGADGKSAYEIAVEHGFEGSEQEWIDSLNYDDDIYALDEKINQEITDRTNADSNLQNQIDSINEKIPEAATADNQLADKKYVLDKIASNSGSFIGAFSSFEELQNYEGTLVKNDYAFIITIETSLKSYKRYQWTGSEWKFEYDLNNSSFTDEQWEAINSNVTATWKTNVDSSLSELDNKQDKLTEIQLRNSADFINCNSGQSAAIQYFKIAETAYREISYDTFQLEGFVSGVLGNNERNYFAINIVNRSGTSPYHSISGFLQRDRKDWDIEIYTNEAGDKREIYFVTSASWVSFSGNCVNYTNNGSIVLNNLPTSSTTAPTGTLLGKLSTSTELQIIGNKADKSHTHSDKTNYRFATMVTTLGFTKNSYVSVRDFWSKLYSTFGGNGVIQFSWASANQAYVGTTTTNVVISGGTLIYTANNVPNLWTNFSAIYYQGGGGNNVYHIKCQIGDDATVGKEAWSITRVVKSDELDKYATKTELSTAEANAKNLANATGVLAITNGGTGKTTAVDASNMLLNALTTGTSTPQDSDYYVSQYAGGGTTNTTYHRRPVSALWTYIKGKIETVALSLLKSSKIKVESSTDLNLTSYDTDPLTVGTKTGLNIGIDNGEIQARNNGAASTLWLNYEGGDVAIGKSGVISNDGKNYNGTSAKATADGSGNSIVNTYATKTELNKKQDKGSTLNSGNLYHYTAETGSHYYWYKILNGSDIATTGKYTKLKITASSDENYAHDAEYVLDVGCYTTTNYKALSVGLVNLYKSNLNNASVCIAIDEDFNIYLQTNCLWTSYVYVEKVAGNVDYSLIKLNHADFGADSSDFVSVNKITNTGNCRLSKNISTNEITIKDGENYIQAIATKATADASGNNIETTYAKKSDLANAGMSVSAKNVMESTGSIDFNTNKAILQLPIYSAEAAYYPTEQGAMWIQEVKI